MYETLLLNNKTAAELGRITDAGTQSLCLSGPKGSGKETVARALCATLARPENQIIIGDENDPSIGIEAVRQIRGFFKLRTNDKSAKRTALVLEAHRLTDDAQNALLKILEEPPLNCYIVLTSTRPEMFLPTITSRLTIVSIENPTITQIETYFSKKGVKSSELSKLITLSDGRIGLLCDLVSGYNSEFIDAIENAKILLSKTIYERLATVDELSKDKKKARLQLEALLRVCSTMIGVQIEKDIDSNPWQERSRLVLESMKYLDTNASVKLNLTNLFLNL